MSEKKWVPWTAETFPTSVFAIVGENGTEYILRYVSRKNGVAAFGYMSENSFQQIFERYKQLGGSPCGTEVEE